MYYLGIDLGTSSVKILATDSKDQIVAEITKEYPVYFPQDKWAQQDPADWWTQTKAAIRELVDTGAIVGEEVAAISFSGQMHGLVALNERNEVLTPAILWCDQRTEIECEEITQYFGSEKLSQLTGNKALTGFTAPKILWVKKNMPEIFAQIRHIMLPKDYISFCLTGAYSTDVSDASGMLLLDVEKRSWSKEMLDFIGITEEMLPKLYESYEVVGSLSDEVAKELGLSANVLVAAGAGDQAAGAVGTGTVSEGIVSVTLGTSGVVFAAHENYAVDGENRLHAFCHANGKYHSMGVMLSAANCLKWWVESIVKDQEFNDLLAEAEKTEMDEKVLFLPYLMGERTPYSDPDAKGAFVGMTMNSERGSLTRAVLEGVAFGLRDSLEILKDIQVPINEIRVIGGGAKSSLWKQILADIFGAPIQEINTNQGGALGAAILAATAAGHFTTVEEGCSKMIRIVSTLEPIEANRIAYDRKYKKYQALYPALQAWYKL